MRPTLVFCALTLAAAGASAAPFPGWMQGCWQATGAEAGSGEQWTSAAGGSMLGMSKTVKGGKTVAFEFVRIAEVEPGKLGYIAQPSGAAPTTFVLLRHSDTEFVFENLAHDFPQRVMYRRVGDKLLHARIEGTSKGKHKSIDFPMRLVSCD
jgi:hypothetical protein